jgi:hypothetical protein
MEGREDVGPIVRRRCGLRARGEAEARGSLLARASVHTSTTSHCSPQTSTRAAAPVETPADRRSSREAQRLHLRPRPHQDRQPNRPGLRSVPRALPISRRVIAAGTQTQESSPCAEVRTRRPRTSSNGSRDAHARRHTSSRARTPGRWAGAAGDRWDIPREVSRQSQPRARSVESNSCSKATRAFVYAYR